jgi:hypothetical protein
VVSPYDVSTTKFAAFTIMATPDSFSARMHPIKKLIAEGEHQQLDFKFAINDSAKIAITLSAFANTDGGRLLVGVKDNGRIAGVRTDEEYHMIEAAAEMYCSPPVYFEAREWDIDGKLVMEVTIPPSKVRPHKAKQGEQWLAYTRVNDENILASPVHLELWKGRLRPQDPEVDLIFTEREHQVLKALNGQTLSLNQVSKVAGNDRKKVINLLAKLVFWGVVEMTIKDGRYWFSAAMDEKNTSVGAASDGQ